MLLAPGTIVALPVPWEQIAAVMLGAQVAAVVGHEHWFLHRVVGSAPWAGTKQARGSKTVKLAVTPAEFVPEQLHVGQS